MGKPTGFKEFKRQTPSLRAPAVRIKDYRELYEPFSEDLLRKQASRCMDCGVPFCHIGCPLGNIIPDWNDLTFRGNWSEALRRLLSTNNFPEFTGRLCPAPCEEACVLGINEPAVTIELIEKSIIEYGFEHGLVKAEPPQKRTGKRVCVVGSGPAGLAAAQQLNRAGHQVTVLERADRIGGLLRYGIPDFKLEKWVIDRRVDLLREEGILFKTGVAAGVNLPVDELKKFDAVVLCGGATKSRDLPIPGREFGGIHLAMDFLPQQNKKNAGDSLKEAITAKDKHVVVIGGGDTGSDCIGTSIRQGAKSVVNFELLDMPSAGRPVTQPWPFWPMRLRTSTSHEEGAARYFSVLTKQFNGIDGQVSNLKTVNIEFVPGADGRPVLREKPGTECEWCADLVLLALGFVGPEVDSVVKQLGLKLDPRGNVATDEKYKTSVENVFCAGDMRRGQSLIVWAISEGREAARCADEYLMGASNLPTKGRDDLPRV